MAKFRLRDRVKQVGQSQVRTVEQIRESPTEETMYWIQLGSDCGSRLWAKESELELVSSGIRSMARPTKGAPTR